MSRLLIRCPLRTAPEQAQRGGTTHPGLPTRRSHRAAGAFTKWVVIALATMLVQPAVIPLVAGEWHYRAQQTCTDCHTQHNSANGQPMRTDNNPAPAPQLLLRDTPLNLCISCHDGSNPSAPDVVTPVSYVPEPAGGYFADTGGVAIDPANSVAHHLNTPAPVVPPGGTQPMILICTTCHDPHGNGSYRNLRPDPSRIGISSVTVMANQSVKANGNNPSQVYVPSNIIYKAGVSAWCENCHGAPVAGSDHPVDKQIFGALKANYTSWTSVTLPRTSVLSPTDDVIPSTDDQVICLSCHKAHGTSHAKATYFADGVTIDSTCQECHNK